MAAALVQTIAGGVSTSGSPLVLNVTTPTTLGNAIIVRALPLGNAVSITDSAGNAYANLSGSIWAAFDTQSIASGGSISLSYSPSYPILYVVEEWSGFNAVDVSGGGNQSAPSSGSYSEPVTCPQAPELLYASIGATGSHNAFANFTPSWTAGAGFTTGTSESVNSSVYGNAALFGQYVAVGSNGSVNVTGTYTGATASNGGYEAFYEPVWAAFYATNPGTVAAPTLTQPVSLASITATAPKTTHAYAYTAQRSPDNSTWTTLATGLTSPTYTDTSPSGSNAYYRFQAVNAFATTNGSSTEWPAPGVTAAPSLTATQIPMVVGLTWTPVTELGYQAVQRSPTGVGSWITVVTNLAASVSYYNDSSIAAATTYYYRIVATNSVASTTGNVSVSITTPTPLMALTLTETYVGSAIAVIMSWQALTGATGYVPQRSTDNASWSSLSASQTGTSYTDATVLPGVKYFYRVQGTNGSGTFYSPVMGIYSPGPLAPLAPTLALNPYYPSAVSIWWQLLPALRPQTFTVQRSTHGNNVWTTLASGIYGGFYEDEGVPNIGAWDYRIIATDGTYSATGTLATITVPVLTPPEPVLSRSGANVLLSWQNASGVTWTVQRSSDVCRTWTSLATGLTSPSYLDSTVTQYTRYWYRVVAVIGANSAAGRPKAIFTDGASPPSNGLRFIVGGQDISGITTLTDPRLDRQVSGTGATMAFGLEKNPGSNAITQWEEFELFDGPQLLHTGWVNDYSRDPFVPGAERTTAQAPDAVGECLNAVYIIAETFEQQTAGWVIRSLIWRYIPGLTTAHVQAGPQLPYYAVQNQTILSAIQQILSLGAAADDTPFFRLRPSLDVSLQFAGNLDAAPVSLTDANPITGNYP